jgi:hypothetical protein
MESVSVYLHFSNFPPKVDDMTTFQRHSCFLSTFSVSYGSSREIDIAV